MTNIYEHVSLPRKLLEKQIGTLVLDLDSMAYRLKVLQSITETLINDKLNSYLASNPGTNKDSLVVTIENQWDEVFPGGPTHLVLRVVINTAPTTTEVVKKPKRKWVGPRNPYD